MILIKGPAVMPCSEEKSLQDKSRSLMSLIEASVHDGKSALQLGRITELCLDWMTDDKNPIDPDNQNTSITAILTSHTLATALKDHIDPSTVLTFQHFLFSTTLAYTGWRDHRTSSHRLSTNDLHRLTNMAGSTLLHKLDALMPSEVANRSSISRQKLQVYFILVFGTIIGVGYSTRRFSPLEQPHLLSLLSPEFRDSPTRWLVAREQLCHLLAGELVTLAKALRLNLDADAEQKVARLAIGEWAHQERWVWANKLLSLGTSSCDPTSEQVGVVDTAGGTFFPAPHTSMVARSEILRAELPLPDTSDSRKERSMIVVGPCEGQQLYARMRARTDSGRPRMIL